LSRKERSYSCRAQEAELLPRETRKIVEAITASDGWLKFVSMTGSRPSEANYERIFELVEYFSGHSFGKSTERYAWQ